MPKKTLRIIKRKSEAKGAAQGRSRKLRSEIAASNKQHARRDGVAVNAGSGKPSAAAAGWAGEVILEGAMSAAEKAEILGMVRHTGGSGPRDPEDRVVRVEDTKKGLRILTSESHLAVSIGKRVDRSHKGGTLAITWAPDDTTVRVQWTKKDQKAKAKK